MEEGKQQNKGWDLLSRTLTTVLSGLLIAWAGIVGNMILSKQESARLITELQIKREQAESQLRKDVFDQALGAFLLKEKAPEYTGSLKDMSKQLLRLELLALNFGDSLSLSPLFAELRKDLDKAKPVNEEEILDYDSNLKKLKKRLVSLAKRVASIQLTSLAQHGRIIPIDIPLTEYKLGDTARHKILFEDEHYAWPYDEVLRQMGEQESNSVSDDLTEIVLDHSQFEFNGVKRRLNLYISNVDHYRLTAKVQILLYREDNMDEPEVDRTFTLDYFNFPTVDNTRISENQRFAIIMDDFDLEKYQQISITCVVFPAEYASLRDRPGMQEAIQLLESAMNGDN